MKRLLSALLLACAGLSLLAIPFSFAQAQELTFTAETTSGNGTVVPVLTWSTAPAADSCIASDAWSGEQGAAGTATFPPIVITARYTLRCAWLADDDVTLNWTNPTERTDGTPYNDRGVTIIDYAPDDQSEFGDEGLWFLHVVTDPLATSTVIPDLAAGDWFFRARAVDADERSSEPSGVAVRIVEAPSEVVEEITITVNPVPLAPTNLTVE